MRERQVGPSIQMPRVAVWTGLRFTRVVQQTKIKTNDGYDARRRRPRRPGRRRHPHGRGRGLARVDAYSRPPEGWQSYSYRRLVVTRHASRRLGACAPKRSWFMTHRPWWLRISSRTTATQHRPLTLGPEARNTGGARWACVRRHVDGGLWGTWWTARSSPSLRESFSLEFLEVVLVGWMGLWTAFSGFPGKGKMTLQSKMAWHKSSSVAAEKSAPAAGSKFEIPGA